MNADWWQNRTSTGIYSDVLSEIIIVQKICLVAVVCVEQLNPKKVQFLCIVLVEGRVACGKKTLLIPSLLQSEKHFRFLNKEKSPMVGWLQTWVKHRLLQSNCRLGSSVWIEHSADYPTLYLCHFAQDSYRAKQLRGSARAAW